jgi:hypothetical protein
MKKISFLLTITCAVFGSTANAQFFDGEGNQMTSCDCNTQLDEMNIKIPSVNYTAYDYLGVQIRKKGDGTILGAGAYTDGEYAPLDGGTLNVLSPENLGYQDVFGAEEGLFGGNVIGLSYNSLCAFKKDIDIEVVIIGVKQIGTETEYTVQGNVVKASTRRIFDDGTILYTSESIPVKARKKVAESSYTYMLLGVIPVSGLFASLVVLPIALISK